MKLRFVVSLLALAFSNWALGFGHEELPEGVKRQIPSGYEVMAYKSGDFDRNGRMDFVIAVHAENEEENLRVGVSAPRRPLLVFLQESGQRFFLVGRNDTVVRAADEGGQCDPFVDGEAGLAAKGAFFTVQNAVACGQHWTDYLTFKYSGLCRCFIFHKRIYEAWKLNTSSKAEADALVLVKREVKAAEASKVVFFSDYQGDLR